MGEGEFGGRGREKMKGDGGKGKRVDRGRNEG